MAGPGFAVAAARTHDFGRRRRRSAARGLDSDSPGLGQSQPAAGHASGQASDRRAAVVSESGRAATVVYDHDDHCQPQAECRELEP